MNVGDVHMKKGKVSLYAKIIALNNNDVKIELIDTCDAFHVSTQICSLERFQQDYQKVCDAI